MVPALLAQPRQELWFQGPRLIAQQVGRLAPADLDRWLTDLEAALTVAPRPARGVGDPL
jgi:acetyl-CoA carboxylase beta subunit